MDNQQQQQDGLDIHLWDYMRIVLSRMHILLTVFISVVLLSMLYTFTRTQLYEGSSRVELKRNSVQIVQSEGTMEEGGFSGVDREFVPTQIKLITSQPVLEKVVEKILDEGSRKPNLRQKFTEMHDPIRYLADNYNVSQVRGSRLIDVKCMQDKPKDTADLVNFLVDSYKSYIREQRQQVSDEGLVELKKKREELRSKLEQAEEDIDDLLEEAKIVSFEDAAAISMQQLKGLSDLYIRAEPNRLDLKAQVETAKRAQAAGKDLKSLPVVIQSPIIIPQITKLSELEIELRDKETRFGSNHREVVGLKSQINTLTKNISELAVAVLESLQTQAKLAEEASASLMGEIGKKEKEVAEIGQYRREHELLKKNRDVIERSWDNVVNRMEEIELSSLKGQGESIFVVSRAKTPSRPAWPRKFRNLILSGLLGGLLGIGACFFMNYMDTTVKSIDDIRDIYKVEVLGSLPPEGVDKVTGDFIAVEKPRSHFAESFRMIRTNLAFAGGKNPPGAIAVSSAVPSEGKSIVSINIAISQAQLGKRVLLLDADMRKPRLHGAFDFTEPGNGLAQLIETVDEGTTMESIKEFGIATDKQEGLVVITSGTKGLNNPAELLDSPRFKKLVATLRENFDFVVFDSPPCASLVDSFIISNATDGLVIVVKTHSTPKGVSAYLADNLRNSGINVLGVVCNNKDAPKRSRLSYYYGYGKYGYGGGYGYGYGYGNKYYENEPGFFGKMFGAKS